MRRADPSRAAFEIQRDDSHPAKLEGDGDAAAYVALLLGVDPTYPEGF